MFKYAPGLMFAFNTGSVLGDCLSMITVDNYFGTWTTLLAVNVLVDHINNVFIRFQTVTSPPPFLFTGDKPVYPNITPFLKDTWSKNIMGSSLQNFMDSDIFTPGVVSV